MPHHQSSAPAGAFHVSTNGCLVEHDRWLRRKAEAADLVRRRYLTLREASEHFALPTEEILSVH
jgi:hypothetical protein